MPIKPPFTQLDIRTAPAGFYAGYSIPIALVSKFSALRNAMIIGSLPFTIVMVLMIISLTKALYRDSLREKHSASEPAAV